MSTLVERLGTLGIPSLDYQGTCGTRVPETLIAERIRQQFVDTYGPLNSLTAKKDLVTTSLPSYLRAKMQPEMVLPKQVKTKDLVFVLHGLGEHAHMFHKLKIMGEQEGERLLVPLDYDDSREFTTYAQEVRYLMSRIAKSIEATRIFALGHSTGADILRYLSSQQQLRDIDGVVLAAPVTNGMIPDVKDDLLFGKKTRYHDPRTPYGQEIIELFQRPLTIPGITIASLDDAFVPLPHAIDRLGRNIIMSGLGHLAGTGNHAVGNKVYLETLKEF